MTDTGFVLTYRLGPASPRVVEAARRAGLDTLRWSGQRDWPASAHPELVVGVIAAGERRIPDELVDIVTRSAPGTPLLLVCEEELVSRSAASSLHDGRVTLLGPPLSSGRLFGEIWIHGPGRRGEAPRTLANGVRSRETAGPRVWLARLGERAGGLAGGEAGGSFTVVVGLEGSGAHANRADAAGAHAAILASTDNAERTAALRALLGERAGVVHLDAARRRWLLYWPSSRAPALLHSFLRLPNVFDSRRARPASGLVELAGATGDVLVALAEPVDADERALDEIASGGPALVDAIGRSTTFSAGGSTASGVVVELRG